MKIFIPPTQGEHIVHIYPANLMEFINGDCKRYYIIDNDEVVYLDMTNNIYEKFGDITPDAWHNVVPECYDATTGECIQFLSATKKFQLELKFAITVAGNPGNKQYYMDLNDQELTDYDGTAYAAFSSLNDFVIYDRHVYYRKNEVLMKRDIIDKTETAMFDITGDFWFMYDVGYEKTFWVMFDDVMYKISHDEIVFFTPRVESAVTEEWGFYYMFQDSIWHTDTLAGSPTLYMGY